MNLSARTMLPAAVSTQAATIRRACLSATLPLVTCLLLTCVAHAVNYSAGSTYSQNFDTLSNTHGATLAWTNDSTLPGWYAMHGGPTYSSFSTYWVNDGGNVTHTLQSLGSIGSSDRSLGCMSYNDTTMWGLKLTNITASTISDFTLTYTGEQWRDQSTQLVAFAYSTSAMSLDDADFTIVPPWTSSPRMMPLPYALDGNAAANRITYSSLVTIPDGWASGTDLWLRWVTGPGQGSGVSIDDLSFTTTVPEPASLCVLGLGALLLARRRRVRT